MSLSHEAARAPQPVRSRNDLEAYFDGGGRDPAGWKIGIEYETPAVRAPTAEALPYDGPAGIRAVLEHLRDHGTWNEVHEGDHLIALTDGHASITLEPGGQVEMSGRPCNSLHECYEELRSHERSLSAAEADLNVRFLGIGMTPKTPVHRMPRMPKERYRIMRSIMSRSGRLGHRMMLQTATVQANFDYSDENDAYQKFRLAMALAPVLVAVSANSPFVDGDRSEYKSFRAHVWTDTDPSRCGMLPFAFDTEGIFNAYTEYALDVPMYFILRNGRYIETEGRTFRNFLTRGFDGHHATVEDWANHLATLFPEARLKTYIEVRSPDSQTANRVLGTPALLKGLFYESDCLTAGWDVLRRWSMDERHEAVESAAREGLSARVHGHPLRAYAAELVDIAREGLRRQGCAGELGHDESVFLTPLLDQLERNECPADLLPTGCGDDWSALIESVAFCRR